ncbi:MAG: hypothetical protein LUG21_08345 [Clostridiales bacterium]|nr:hypothetical protein [Clostridiales bacterium]
MKLSKRMAALFAAVLMAIAMSTGMVSAYAAVPAPGIKVSTGSYGNYEVTGYRSVNSSTQMSGRAKANAKATRIATTIVARNEDSKGNVKATGGTPDKGADNATDSGIANVTSGSGNNFKWIQIYYAGMYNNNLDHTASTIYKHTF